MVEALRVQCLAGADGAWGVGVALKKDRLTQIKILRRLEAEDYPELYQEYVDRKRHGFVEALTPDWTEVEAYQIELMLEDKLLVRDEEPADSPFLNEPSDAPVIRRSYIRPSSIGHDFAKDSVWHRRFFLVPIVRLGAVLVSKAGSVVVSIVTAVLTVMVMGQLGLLK